MTIDLSVQANHKANKLNRFASIDSNMSLERQDGRRVVIVRNPGSSGARRADEFLEYLGVHVIDSLSGGVESNYNKLVSAITDPEDSVLVSLGGDGLANTLGNCALELGCCFVPLPFGHANDISRSIYGRGIRQFHRMKRVIREGEPSEQGALKIGIGDNETHAFGYFGLGATGYIAELFNSQEVRSNRPEGNLSGRVSDATVAMSGLRSYLQRSTITMAGEGFDPDKEVREILFNILPRMSDTFKFDLERDGSLAMWNVFAANRFVAKTFAKVVRGLVRGGVAGQDCTKQDSVFSVESPDEVWVQIDGESSTIPCSQVISVQHIPRALSVLKLAAGYDRLRA